MSIPLTGAGRTALSGASEATYGAAFLGLPYNVSGGSYAFLGLPNVELTYLLDENGDPKAPANSRMVQYEEYTYSTVSSIASVVPVDGSFDSSDGTEIFDESMAPENANSNLFARVRIFSTGGGTTVAQNPKRVIVGVFVDSETAPRYIVSGKWQSQAWCTSITFTADLGPFQNMSSKSVKVRIGQESGGFAVLLNSHDSLAASGNWTSPSVSNQVTMALFEMIL